MLLQRCLLKEMAICCVAMPAVKDMCRLASQRRPIGLVVDSREELREHSMRQKALQKELSRWCTLKEMLRVSAANLRQHLETCQVLSCNPLTDSNASEDCSQAQNLMYATAAQPGRCTQA